MYNEVTIKGQCTAVNTYIGSFQTASYKGHKMTCVNNSNRKTNRIIYTNTINEKPLQVVDTGKVHTNEISTPETVVNK